VIRVIIVITTLGAIAAISLGLSHLEPAAPSVDRQILAILLADEPTGNLDSNNGETVMGLLAELHREGATICMVTHDPRYAHNADRTVHLFDGRIVEDKETERSAL
jgi:ABC-type ATPase involved in cell division